MTAFVIICCFIDFFFIGDRMDFRLNIQKYFYASHTLDDYNNKKNVQCNSENNRQAKLIFAERGIFGNLVAQLNTLRLNRNV